MISFEEYCEDFLDEDISLMNEKQLRLAKQSYASFIKDKDPQESEHQKALAKAKESRKLAKFYGGKALTGSAAQKKWAEDIRQKILESDSLTDNEKTELVSLGGFTNTASFWINNRDKDPLAFKPETILTAYKKLKALYEKHFDTLARSGPTHIKDAARKEIYAALLSLEITIKMEFPNCDFYDAFGSIKKDLTFNC